MSQFDFTEAQETLRREVARFAQKELAPGVKERLKKGLFEPDLLKKMGEMGLLGINLPAAYGGNTADWVSVGIAIEEIAKVDPMAAHLAAFPAALAQALLKGEKEVVQEWLPPLINGEKIGCLAITEPDAGSDLAGMKARGLRDSGHYILNGEKAPVSLGAQADMALVFAKTDLSHGIKSMSCFLVPTSLSGISHSTLATLGKSEGLASLSLEEVKIPLKYRLGEEGEGLAIIMAVLDVTRVGAGLIALGMAESCLEDAIKYARQRIAFNRPIARFEAISFKIAEDATRIEAARLLCYRSLSLKDKGLSTNKEAAMCKWFCPEVALQAVHNSLLIHGFIGYSEEYSIEERLRDTIGEEIASGTAEMMKIIISQQIIGKIASPF